MDKKTLKIKFDEKYVKDIITDYDALSERCFEIELAKSNTDIQKTIVELKNTIRKHNLLGLSANQIGKTERVLCLNFNGNIKTFVNPILTDIKGLELSRETCSSIPNKEYIRLRHTKVSVTYQTPLGKIDSVDLVGVAAKAMQHHIDHLDGLLLSDIGLEVDAAFDNATEEERQEVIDMYLDSLDLTREAITTDIENDEEAKKISDAIKFIDSVKKGETIVESQPLTDAEFDKFKNDVEEYRNKHLDENK